MLEHADQYMILSTLSAVNQFDLILQRYFTGTFREMFE